MKPWNCLQLLYKYFTCYILKTQLHSTWGSSSFYILMYRHTSLFSFVSYRNCCYSSWRAGFCSAIHFHSISITSVLMLIQLSLHGILVLLWIDSAFQLCVINIFHKPTPTFWAKTTPWGTQVIAYLQLNTFSLDTECCHLFNQFLSHLIFSLLIPLFLTYADAFSHGTKPTVLLNSEHCISFV